LIVGAAAYFRLNTKKNKGQNVSTDFRAAEREKVSAELDKMLSED